jgi:hypothetical protein
MVRKVVTRRYSAWNNGPVGGWQVGAEVDLDEDVAAWVERDSPGTLVDPAPPEPEPAPEPERQASPPANRQHRGGRNRARS